MILSLYGVVWYQSVVLFILGQFRVSSSLMIRKDGHYSSSVKSLHQLLSKPLSLMIKMDSYSRCSQYKGYKQQMTLTAIAFEDGQYILWTDPEVSDLQYQPPSSNLCGF